MPFKTFSPTPDDIDRKWWVVDAKDQPLGRLASRVAQILMGKHKPSYTTHVDTGDFVVVVNADKVVLTGKKEEQNEYMFFNGYVGRERYTTVPEMRERHPEFIIEHAVKGMLPKNRLARRMITKLKVYAGPEHPHAAQEPKPLPAV